jgi:hypothetical protein
MAKKPSKTTQTPTTGKVTSIREALDKAGPRPADSATASAKKNYAERFSRLLATYIASALRGRKFEDILPTDEGDQQESRARTSKGLKKLDVNYSTPQLGLALGVSIKSINFRDPTTRRYTKNYSRNDNELRAEATDYHQRQPYAVLAAVIFLPVDSCNDAGSGTGKEQGISSFGACVRYFRPRAKRKTHRNDVDLFERVFIGLYVPEGDQRGETVFFDVMQPPPKNRRPRPGEVLTFEQVMDQIKLTYDERNDPPFEWAD